MKKGLLLIVLFILVANVGCMKRNYSHPAVYNNKAYNKAYINEHRLLRQQRERDIRSRAEEDFKRGVDFPPTNQYERQIYRRAWDDAEISSYKEAYRLWERQEGRRAIEDARKGVYQPW